MKEVDFIQLYKINKKLKTVDEAKEKIDIFWKTVIETLKTEEDIVFRHWGKFKLKRCKPRKYSSPYSQEIGYTQEKYTIKFKIGNSLKKSLNNKSKEWLNE